MGVDVEPGCSSQEARRCFSVVILEDDQIIFKREGVPLHKLIRLLWEYQPRILAVDNIYELAENQKALKHILSFLPLGIDVIQVTVNPDGSLEDMSSLVKRYGLSTTSGKLTPIKTAYYAALLALRGQGARVRFAEDKTRIVVSKSRSLGAGGMSQNRYMRRVRAVILRATKDIRRVLDKAGLDYDLVFRKSGGGLESAVFIVYAPRKKLEGLVKPHEDSDIRIEVKPVYTHVIGFETEQKHQERYSEKPYVIVGVDPGIVTGIAIVDLNGRILYVDSARGLDRQAAVEIIMRHGIPVLVATDVKPAPEYVKKLAANLQVQVYEPPEPLSVEEKREIVAEKLKASKLTGKIDSHMRDALAAALKAYRYYQSKLKRVEAYLSSINNVYLDSSRIKADVVRGYTIADALEREIRRVLDGGPTGLYLLKRIRRKEEKTKQEAPSQLEERIADLQNKILLLEAENKKLFQKVKELEQQLEEERREYNLLRIEFSKDVEESRKIAMLRHEVEVLRKTIGDLKEEKKALKTSVERLTRALLAVSKGELLVALKKHKLGYDEVRDIDARTIIVADEVSPSLRRAWEKKIIGKIIAVLLPSTTIKSRVIYGIPVLPREEYVVEDLGELVLVKPEVVVDAFITRLVEERKKKNSEGEEKKLTVEELKAMFEEYRRMRAKTLFSKLQDRGGEEEAAAPPKPRILDR